MSLAERLPRQLSDNNLEFKEVWEDPERQQQFDLSYRLVKLRKELGMTQQQLVEKIRDETILCLSARKWPDQYHTLEKLHEIAHRLGARVHVSIELDQGEAFQELLTK